MSNQPLQPKSSQGTQVLLSFLMLSSAMLLWPEFYLFSKSVKLPVWASYLPSPMQTGAYLATLGLIPVAWGLARFDRAVKATSLVLLVSPVIPIFSYALARGHTDYLWSGAAFNYVFVLGLSLAAPALSLLALRWAWRRWFTLK